MEDPARAIPLEKLVAHREWVRRVARALVRDEALADDLEQEVWLEALQTPPRSGRSLGGWLAAAMRHNLVDHQRSEGRRRVREEAVARPEIEKSAADVVAEAEMLKVVVVAVMDLEEPCRGTLLLRYFEDLPLKEVARRQGIPLETVRTRIRTAIALLRERFDSERGGDRKAWCLALLPLVGKAETAVPASAGTIATIGGLAMANKAVLTLAGLLVLGAAGWLAFRTGEAPPSSTPTGAARAGATLPPRSTSPQSSGKPASTPAPAAPIEGVPPPVDLDKCDRDLDVFGVVVDDKGVAVPGATVECVRYPWRRSSMAEPGRSWESEKGPSTRSASDGTFSLRLLRGQLVDVVGTAPGLGQGEVAQCQAGERVRLVLRREGGTLVVRTLDEEKRPVQGARLRLWGSSGAYGAIAFVRRGVTGEDGRFVFPHLAAGKALLRVEHDELGQPDWGQPVIPAEGNLELEFVLPRGRVVSGRVTDASTGKPLVGAQVGSNWVMDRPVKTSEDGRYSFPGWTGKGTTVMTAAGEGYASLMLSVPPEGDLDFALEAAFAASGRVVDAEGNAVPGALVVASGHWEDGQRRGSDRSSGVSDAGGRFSLGGLSRRAGHSVVAEAPGHGRALVTFDAPEGEAAVKELGDISLASPRAIEGRALDTGGKPVVGQPVTLSMLRSRDDPASRELMGGAFPGMGELRRTDDLGRFRFPDLPPGNYGLKLNVPGSPIVEADVELPADRDILDVVLQQKGRSITLLVTDQAGKPLEGITVMTDSISPHPTVGVRGMTSVQAITGTDGRVTLRNLPAEGFGEKGIRFSIQPYSGDTAPPYAWLTTEPIVPEGQEVRVALKPVALVKGRVLGPDGEAIPGLYVNAFDAAGKGVGVDECKADGSFSMRVPAGEPLAIRVPGHRKVTDPKDPASGQSPFRAEVEGVVGPASDLLLRARRLGANGAIDVLVVDLDGKPVPGYEVGIIKTNEPQRTARTDGAGRLRFEGLLEDTWFLAPRTRVPEGSPVDIVEPAMVEVVPSGQQVVLRYRKGVPLEGSVFHSDGSPAEGASVWAQFMWGSPMKQTKADASGRFRLFMGEGDVAFLLTASWWNEEKKGFSADLRNVKTGGPEIVFKLEPMKPR